MNDSSSLLVKAILNKPIYTFLNFNFLFQEWFIHSGTNICYVAYAFDNYQASVFNLIFYIKKILQTNRVEYVARETLGLVLNLRKKCTETKSKGCVRNMSQLTVLGNNTVVLGY